MARQRSPSPLALLRRLWVGVALGIITVTVLVVIAGAPDATIPLVLPVGLTAVAGAAAAIGARAIDRFFAASPPDDDATALLELRQRAYLAIGIAEAPLLLGVAIAFVIGPGWVAAVGALGALAVLAVARPTLSRLRRIDAAWQHAGADASLLRAVEAAEVAPADPEPSPPPRRQPPRQHD